MKIYIGHDDREQAATDAALKSLEAASLHNHSVELLCADKLADRGLLWRVSDHRGGQDYDLVSNAPKSTRFAISRFLTPILCQEGFALFTDCDVVFREDPAAMLYEVDRTKAVSVVKHHHEPTDLWKMVNQKQTRYPRKNWSSVMLFNCDHPANRRLTLRDVNERPGRDLHAFYWLHDDEIGALDARWNWLVGEQPEPSHGGIAHFTRGGPWIAGWVPAEHDNIWLEASR